MSNDKQLKLQNKKHRISQAAKLSLISFKTKLIKKYHKKEKLFMINSQLKCSRKILNKYLYRKKNYSNKIKLSLIKEGIELRNSSKNCLKKKISKPDIRSSNRSERSKHFENKSRINIHNKTVSPKKKNNCAITETKIRSLKNHNKTKFNYKSDSFNQITSSPTCNSSSLIDGTSSEDSLIIDLNKSLYQCEGNNSNLENNDLHENNLSKTNIHEKKRENSPLMFDVDNNDTKISVFENVNNNQNTEKNTIPYNVDSESEMDNDEYMIINNNEEKTNDSHLVMSTKRKKRSKCVLNSKSDESSEDDDTSKFVSKVKKVKFYTIEEDCAIINFIANENKYNEVSGKAIWQSLERKKYESLKHRSWESMKERFRMRIKPNIDKYKISEEIKKKIQNIHMYQGCEKNKEKSDRTPYSSEEDMKIIKYLIEKDFLSEVNGVKIWKKMEEQLNINRTWQSLKNRFQKNIIKNIDFYKLSQKKKELLLSTQGN